jgi:hypothetical protein
MKVSKALLFTAFLSFVGLVSKAQTNFGIKGGFDQAIISDGDGSHFTGFGGFFVNTNLGYHWHLQPELLYSGAGGVYGNGYYFNPNSPYNTTVSMGYIQVPVMLQYRFNPGFYLEFGPQLGVLTNATYITDGERQSGTSDYNTVDFALDFGLGFRLGPVVSLFTRYELGLSNVYSSSANDGTSNTGVPTAYNRNFQFGIGFTFPSHNDQGEQRGGGHRRTYYGR